MDLTEVMSLIKVRGYVVNSIALPTIGRATVAELNGILLLLDKKIIEILTGPNFKDYIGYKDVQKAKEDAARITNIRSGLNGRK